MADRPRDTEKSSINQNYFTGGQSISRKLGIANAFYSSTNLDFRSDPSQISVLPGAQTLSNNLADLITDMEQDLNGVRWGIGSNGGLYKISTSNIISREAQLTESGSAGLLYNQVNDQLYIPGQTAVSMYGKCTSAISNPQFRANQFAESASQANGTVNLYNPSSGFFDGTVGVRNNAASINQVGITSSTQVTTSTTETYTLPSVLSESIGNFCFFAPDIEPFFSIDVYVASPGTGDWTLTLHDSLNDLLATVTVPNANIVPNSYNRFLFSSPVRALVNASQTGTSGTYHYHLTSSVSNDTATTGTINPDDLSSGDFLLYAYRLVPTNNGWHPTAIFTGANGGVPALCIGNGEYLSTYNFGNDANPTNSQWVRHDLFFKPGYEVCGLATNNQYLVIAAERRSTNSSRNAQDGILYFWDGTTQSPSFTIDVPMGSPYGLYTFNNVTYFACAGSLFAWSGGQTVIKVRKLAYQNTDYLGEVDSTIINPNMFTSRYNLLMMGYPSSSTNPNLTFGTWSWGTVELTFPNTYGLSYTLSNGQLNSSGPSGNNLQIGCVQNFVDSMYVSWQYTSNGQTYYGMDLINNFSTPASTFSWYSLIWDGGSRYKTKQALRYKISLAGPGLPLGCTLTPVYSLDRGPFISADPGTGTSYEISTEGEMAVVIELNSARFHEIQWGFTGTCTNATTAPTITGVTMEVNPLPDEIDVKPEGLKISGA